MPIVKKQNRAEFAAATEKDLTIRHKIDKLVVNEEQIAKFIQVLQHEMENGLSGDEEVRKSSSLQMICTFVRDIMNGSEQGEYLALDLGGTNFRVLFVRVTSSGKCIAISSQHSVPQNALTGTAEELFDYIVECIEQFLMAENLLEADQPYPLGLTFSFPVEQTSVDSGKLVAWAKNFRNTTGAGEDVVQLLTHSLKKKATLPIRVVALLNDTTGTLMSGAFQDNKCVVGLILGTGSNACYMEKLSKVKRWNFDNPLPPQVIVNIEWGRLGENGCLDFLRSEYDKILDRGSSHPGSHIFEKMLGGMYLGEIARLVLVSLAEQGLIFSGKLSEKMSTPYAFETRYISLIELDGTRDVSNTYKVMRELDMHKIADDDDFVVIRYLCSVLTVRAAKLVAAALSVLLNRVDQVEVTVAVDGSLYTKHPRFGDLLSIFLEEYIPDKFCQFRVSEDGSGKGAAFVAAVVDRLQKHSYMNGGVNGTNGTLASSCEN